MAVLDIARSWELQRQEGSDQTTKNTKYTKENQEITTESESVDSFRVFRVFRGSNSDAPDSGGSNLSKGVTETQKTLEQYVVTPQPTRCFQDALRLITSAVDATISKACYLHGSFGAGNSQWIASEF